MKITFERTAFSFPVSETDFEKLQNGDTDHLMIFYLTMTPEDAQSIGYVALGKATITIEIDDAQDVKARTAAVTQQQMRRALWAEPAAGGIQ